MGTTTEILQETYHIPICELHKQLVLTQEPPLLEDVLPGLFEEYFDEMESDQLIAVSHAVGHGESCMAKCLKLGRVIIILYEEARCSASKICEYVVQLTQSGIAAISHSNTLIFIIPTPST